MKRKKLHTKLIKKYPEPTVYNWLNGNRTPRYEIMVDLKNTFKIPFTAWQDIKSYLQEQDTKQSTPKSNTQTKAKV